MTKEEIAYALKNYPNPPLDRESPLNVQVGGGHYKDLKIQPIEFIHANDLSYIEGCVIKYITRWRNKNGVEDLEKIKHYIDLLITLEGDDNADNPAG